jgi:hypothetical protein
MVVGSPVLPIGSWRSQTLRSKFPPGAQEGFSPAVGENKKEMARNFERVAFVDIVTRKSGGNKNCPKIKFAG